MHRWGEKSSKIGDESQGPQSREYGPRQWRCPTPVHNSAHQCTQLATVPKARASGPVIPRQMPPCADASSPGVLPKTHTKFSHSSVGVRGRRVCPAFALDKCESRSADNHPRKQWGPTSARGQHSHLTFRQFASLQVPLCSIALSRVPPMYAEAWAQSFRETFAYLVFALFRVRLR